MRIHPVEKHGPVMGRRTVGGRKHQQGLLRSSRSCLLGLAVVIAAISTERSQSATPDAFLWSGVPSNAVAGVPFVAAVRAADADGNTATGYDGIVGLTGRVRAPAPRLLISELLTVGGRTVELCNVSQQSVTLGGWKVTFYDSTNWPGPRTSFTFPAGAVCPPAGFFVVYSGGTAPGAYPSYSLGTNLAWAGNQAANPIAVLLQDDRGEPVDFVAACGGYPLLINDPLPIPSGLWQGLPLPPLLSGGSYQRFAAMNHNNVADWRVSSFSTLGSSNFALRLPFSAPLRTVPVSPATIQFSNGLWQGWVTIQAGASNIWLHADDGAGISGDSAPLFVAAGPPLALHLPPGGSEATAGPLGLGTVSIPQPVATNLIITLTAVPAGEIALPPTVTLAAGESSVSIPVTNLDDALLEIGRASL